MAIADLEQLCKGVCDIAGMRMPVLQPSDKGIWSVTVHLRGIEVTVMQFATRAPRKAFLIADLGAPPEQIALAAWRTLMDANRHMAGEQAPAFSRNFESGNALLHWACPYWDTTVIDVYQRIEALVDLACRWRRDGLLGDRSAAHSWVRKLSNLPSAATEEARSASFIFGELYRNVCAALKGPVPEVAPDHGSHAFTLQVHGFDIVAAHSLQQEPGCAIVVLRLDTPPATTELQEMQALMDANFTLMSVEQGARFSRESKTGTLLLQYAHRLKTACPDEFLSQLEGLTRLAAEWQGSVRQARSRAAGIANATMN
jgi:hypothetical protein